mmetsp:Transcript_41640/g.67747  ORF Transcript_41640/g.67747 Transcript_41640/m.67747 type:complete len:225 (-) Transcript_41640:848-1522(-)
MDCLLLLVGKKEERRAAAPPPLLLFLTLHQASTQPPPLLLLFFHLIAILHLHQHRRRPAPPPLPSSRGGLCTSFFLPHFRRGLRTTARYMGVKVPVAPPREQPMPPCCSIICTLQVPAGASRTFSISQSRLAVSHMPTPVNWKRWVKMFQLGMSGRYQTLAPGASFLSRAMSRVSSNSKPTFSSALSTSQVGIMSGSPSPSSMAFLILRCSSFLASYLSVRHHS